MKDLENQIKKSLEDYYNEETDDSDGGNNWTALAKQIAKDISGIITKDVAVPVKVNAEQLLNALLAKCENINFNPKALYFSEDSDGSNTHVICFQWCEAADSWYLLLDYIGGDSPAILRTDLYNDFDEFELELIYNTIKDYFSYRNLNEVYIKDEIKQVLQ